MADEQLPTHADMLWWEIDNRVVLLPRDQWPYQPRRLGVITSLPAEERPSEPPKE